MQATLSEPMTEEQYRAAPGLSQSAMKDLMVSPLRFWHRHINPDRPKDEPTPEMQFGSALHCAILEPDEFDARYARELIVEDYPGCLVTIEDLRNFMREAGTPAKGTRKADVVAQVHSAFPTIPIFDVLAAEHYQATKGKVLLSAEDWHRLAKCAESLLAEPKMAEILSEGHAEAPVFGSDPETGAPLKARMDWVRDGLTLDVKTFSQKRGKSIERSIADAIFYEGYYRQAYFYALLRGWPKDFSGEFVMAFVESEPPHEVRLRALRPKIGGNANLYWERARVEVRQLIRTYAECMDHFGDKPWRYAQEITVLADEEMPGLSYSA